MGSAVSDTVIQKVMLIQFQQRMQSITFETLMNQFLGRARVTRGFDAISIDNEIRNRFPELIKWIATDTYRDSIQLQLAGGHGVIVIIWFLFSIYLAWWSHSRVHFYRNPIAADDLMLDMVSIEWAAMAELHLRVNVQIRSLGRNLHRNWYDLLEVLIVSRLCSLQIGTTRKKESKVEKWKN